MLCFRRVKSHRIYAEEWYVVDRKARSRARQRRLIHTALLLIIVATLPCYCVGAFLLGLAPDGTQAGPGTQIYVSPVSTLNMPSPTNTLWPTITPLQVPFASATAYIGGTLATPGQYYPPPPTRVFTLTFTPTFTSTFAPTATVYIPISTIAPSITLTFTYTPAVVIPTNTLVVATLPPAATATKPPPTNTPVPLPTNTPAPLTNTPVPQPTSTTAPLPSPTQETLGG